MKKLEVKDLKKSFYSRKGLFGKEEFQAVRSEERRVGKECRSRW